LSRSSSISNQQLQDILARREKGSSERQIARELGLTQTKVHNAIARYGQGQQQQKVVALVSKPLVQETQKSVFDIMARLEECLTEVEKLMDDAGPLKDRVAVRSEKRMLIAEARATLESIYNIRVLNDFVTEVTAILEEQSPGARKRIFERLEASAGAHAAISLFAANS
jgi:predicted transcriptional regulator